MSRREVVPAEGAAQWSSLAVAMSWRAAQRHAAKTYASVNGLQLYYESRAERDAARRTALDEAIAPLLEESVSASAAYNPSSSSADVEQVEAGDALSGSISL